MSRLIPTDAASAVEPALIVYSTPGGIYDVKIVTHPEHNMVLYGIVNKRFGVIEGYVSQLARVIQLADLFERQLKEGIPSEEEEIAELVLAEMERMGPKGGSGRAN